ncbi:MAG: hypothetical protein KDA85_20570, partial [Planctomycetaceae bacterium]|nr:hypothetical protein [Planctomycetaceae bacterium]
MARGFARKSLTLRAVLLMMDENREIREGMQYMLSAGKYFAAAQRPASGNLSMPGNRRNHSERGCSKTKELTP